MDLPFYTSGKSSFMDIKNWAANGIEPYQTILMYLCIGDNKTFLLRTNNSLTDSACYFADESYLLNHQSQVSMQ